VESAEIAGGGFINFTLSRSFYVRELMRLFETGEEFTKLDVGRGETIIIEFVSSNPTGPLTVGHGRQAALGDVLSNVCEEAGYRVTREYYFNDARQMDLWEVCYARYRQQFARRVPRGRVPRPVSVHIAEQAARIRDRSRIDGMRESAGHAEVRRPRDRRHDRC
jgi:arginyl-tRNA synthetase